MLTIYKASAGSGKTYTLAYEYIKLLLGVKLGDGYVLNHPKYARDAQLRRPHSRILAITFTNMATAEMKSRIIRELEGLTHVPEAGGKDAAYAADLTAAYGCTREELASVARKSLNLVLNDYSAFNISTIDSFFQIVLRSFAREIDRQGDYRVELEERAVLSQALTLLFDDVNLGGDESRAVADWLKEMARERMEQGDDFNPFNRQSPMYGQLVGNLAKTFNEDFIAREAEMTQYLADNSRLLKFRNWLRAEIEALAAREMEATRALHDGLAGYGKSRDLTSLVKFLQKILAAGRPDKDMVAALTRPTTKYLQKIKDGEGADSYPDGSWARISAWYDTMVECGNRRLIYAEMLSKINTLRSLVYIHGFIERYRQENNLILIADTNSLLGSIIEGTDTPFIYERVGMQLENFLIDEFQDTSTLQWRNLRPLLANSLDQGYDSLIIGDEKQSIFRWRGGDPALLATKVADEDFPGNNTVRGNRPGENTNYRSAHDIVRFNNAMFSRIAALPGMDVPGYAGVAQSLGKPATGLSAWIRVNDLTAEGKEGRERSLEKLAADIIDQHRRGYSLSDIAILCRSKDECTEVADYLLANHHDTIRVISNEALKLVNSQAVRLIISMLEIIDKSYGTDSQEAPAADEAPARLTDDEKKLMRKMAKRRQSAMLADSFEYYHSHGASVEEALQKAIESSRRAVARLLEAIDRAEVPAEAVTEGGEHGLMADLDSLRKLAPASLPALVEAIIMLKIPERMQNDERPYISAFVDIVGQFTGNFIPSVHSFLNYWRENRHGFAIQAGANEDAVNILTIHKAKGLEWDCVHIPFLNWYLDPEKSEQWFELGDEFPADVRPPIMYLEPNRSFVDWDGSPFAGVIRRKNMEKCGDEVNVLYVAFTRAARELNVTMLAPSKVRKELRKASDVVAAAMLMPGAGNVGDDALYMNLEDFMVAPEGGSSFEFGAPTAPVVKKPHADAEPLSGPPFRVSFNPLNSQLTQLADLTFADLARTGQTDDDPAIDRNMPDREIVDEYTNSVMEAAARQGLVLHSILSQMATIDDLDSAIAYHRRDIEAGELENYRRMLDEAFSRGGGQAASWFSPDNPRVMMEQPIYNAATGENRRVDRIVWLPDGTVNIIDYKFTTAPRRSHLVQVREYASLLESMGYGDVKAHLWYPLLGKIIEA